MQTPPGSTFYVFVSSADNGADRKWASWIARRLENYRIPVAELPNMRQDDETTADTPAIPELFRMVRGEGAESERCRILDDSRYLVVICSPRAAASAIVNNDVRHFCETGKEENIIPFIVDGEPAAAGDSRCYPFALSTDILGVTLAGGSREEALFKVIARLLRLKYSRLYQRHLRQQRRFMARLLAAAAVLLAVMASLAAWALQAEISAGERREAADGMTNFLGDVLKKEARIPAGVRSIIDAKIDEYREKSGKNSGK